jgi:hypothetical protein
MATIHVKLDVQQGSSELLAQSSTTVPSHRRFLHPLVSQSWPLIPNNDWLNDSRLITRISWAGFFGIWKDVNSLEFDITKSSQILLSRWFSVHTADKISKGRNIWKDIFQPVSYSTLEFSDCTLRMDAWPAFCRHQCEALQMWLLSAIICKKVNHEYTTLWRNFNC